MLLKFHQTSYLCHLSLLQICWCAIQRAQDFKGLVISRCGLQNLLKTLSSLWIKCTGFIQLVKSIWHPCGQKLAFSSKMAYVLNDNYTSGTYTLKELRHRSCILKQLAKLFKIIISHLFQSLPSSAVLVSFSLESPLLVFFSFLGFTTRL